MSPRLADPWLLLLLLIPLAVILWRERRGGAAFGGFGIASATLRRSHGPLLFRLLMVAGLSALVIAAARPQYGRVIVERQQSGRDLMLVIDLSGSMRVDDIATPDGERIDRLRAVFDAATRFVGYRTDDRIGLVFFGSDGIGSCPLTYDHATVKDFLERTETQQRALWNRSGDRGEGLVGDGTNLGLGMGLAVKALRDPKAKGRAVILITDGADTRELPNWIDPLQAARHAANLRNDAGDGVRIYGIGVGNPRGQMTQHDPFGRVFTRPLPPSLLPDMARLEAITALADGQAFAANDRAGLDAVLKKIDLLEPTPHEVKEHEDFHDQFRWPLVAGIALIALALTFQSRLRGLA